MIVYTCPLCKKQYDIRKEQRSPGFYSIDFDTHFEYVTKKRSQRSIAHRISDPDQHCAECEDAIELAENSASIDVERLKKEARDKVIQGIKNQH